MERGIGRAGYRLLAIGLFLMGLTALATLLLAFPIEVTVLSVLSAAVLLLAILSLPVLTWVLTRLPRHAAASGDAQEAQSKGRRHAGPQRRWWKKDPAVELPTHRAEAPQTLSAIEGLDFEYPDHRVAKAGVRAPRHREDLVDFLETPEPVRLWENDDGRSPEATEEEVPKWMRPPKTRVPPRTEGFERREFTEKYTREAPMVRNILTSAATASVFEEIPEVTAEIATRQAVKDPASFEKVQGRCGGCTTDLLAPSARPIRVRCPRCAKTTLLRA